MEGGGGDSVPVGVEVFWSSWRSGGSPHSASTWTGEGGGVVRDVMLFTEQLCMLESQHVGVPPAGAPLVELRGCHKIFSCCAGGWSWTRTRTRTRIRVRIRIRIRIISEVCLLFVFDFSSDCSYSQSTYKQTPPLPVPAALLTDRTLLLHCP